MARLYRTINDQDDEGWYAWQGGGLAALAVPMINYDDGVETRSAELAGAFFDAVAAELGLGDDQSLDTARESLSRACGVTCRRFPGATWGLIFTVLRHAGKDRWQAFNLGANAVLHVSGGRAELAVDPHSPLFEQDLDELSDDDRMSVSGISTAMLEPDRLEEATVRAVEVSLAPGDWLIAAPGSATAATLAPSRQPVTLEEIERQVIDPLAAGHHRYPRCWLAVQVAAGSSAPTPLAGLEL